VDYLVLEFREEKQTFAKVEGSNVDFFLSYKSNSNRRVIHVV
jgi:hypothetical protein